MTDERQDAIAQLERRVATLENMVRRLTFVATGARPVEPRSASPSVPVVRAALPTVTPKRDTDLEQWFGQRGLLAVGVAALLIAAAFFLKYAIDRGWISPLLRALLAIASGAGVAAWGHERITKGMRRYGAALIGAGGGLLFLGLWAAAGPYGLIDRRIGILLLAATTVAVTLLALHHQIEGLALWALTGAYLAPVLLRPPVPNPDAFLGYLEVVGLGTGLLAYNMNWRRTFNLALFGYLLLAAAGAASALASPTGCWLIAAGALLTLHVTHRRSWPETRLGLLLLAWAILGVSMAGMLGADGPRWLALGALAAVTALLFHQHLQRNPLRARAQDAVADQFLFIITPVAFVGLAFTPRISLIQNTPEIVPATLAVAYLGAGWWRRAAAFLITGCALAALAMGFAWPPAAMTTGWIALALLALAAEREYGRAGGRQAVVALASAAGFALFFIALDRRAFGAPVFTDPWALALYAYIAGTAVAARWWGTETTPTLWLWLLCGAAVFGGGSIQLAAAFGRIGALAGNLALSLWWLVYAGAAVALGFRLDRKMIRSAGLLVAAGAGFKIVFYDLSTLEALYRVASFFALALIALAVAYAYNRRAKVSAV
ncbi:MAG: DUF2339 domain-containing protein [Gemmatimonadales bacterium]